MQFQYWSNSQVLYVAVKYAFISRWQVCYTCVKWAHEYFIPYFCLLSCMHKANLTSDHTGAKQLYFIQDLMAVCILIINEQYGILSIEQTYLLLHETTTSYKAIYHINRWVHPQPKLWHDTLGINWVMNTCENTLFHEYPRTSIYHMSQCSHI